MAYVWWRTQAEDLRRAFRILGHPGRVIEVEGWSNRGRPASVGSHNPVAAIWHHVGTPSSASRPAPSVPLLVSGRSDLPGPLCQNAPDYQGNVYVIAAGRANVNGKVSRGQVPVLAVGVDGNSMGVGFEVQTDGTQKLPALQFEAACICAAVFLLHKGYTADQVARRTGRHENINGNGKWDIGNATTAALQARTVAIMRILSGAGTRPAPTPPGDDDMPLNDADKAWIKSTVEAAVKANNAAFLATKINAYYHNDPKKERPMTVASSLGGGARYAHWGVEKTVTGAATLAKGVAALGKALAAVKSGPSTDEIADVFDRELDEALAERVKIVGEVSLVPTNPPPPAAKA